MRVGLDTNILVYAAGHGESTKGERATTLLESFGPDDAVIPAQALGEFVNVMTRKESWPADRTRDTLQEWSDSFLVAPTTSQTVRAAVEIASEHRLQIWDAVILAASRNARCNILLSEDMHNGFEWRGIMVVNPFANSAWRFMP